MFRLLLVGLLFLLLGNRALATSVPAAPAAPSLAPSLATSFAIADFDGDHRLDYARVDAGERASSSAYSYWIQFDLTASGRQAIHVVAPFGGLAIEARDVNGDNAPDLIVTTAWLRQPVAVFLNDGHGRFFRADTHQFSQAFRTSSQNWTSPTDHATGTFGLPPQSRSGISSELVRLPDVRGPTDSPAAVPSASTLDSVPIAHAGRAPPFEESSL